MENIVKTTIDKNMCLGFHHNSHGIKCLKVLLNITSVTDFQSVIVFFKCYPIHHSINLLRNLKRSGNLNTELCCETEKRVRMKFSKKYITNFVIDFVAHDLIHNIKQHHEKRIHFICHLRKNHNFFNALLYI